MSSKTPPVADRDTDDEEKEEKKIYIDDDLKIKEIYPKPILFSSIFSVSMDETIEEVIDEATKAVLRHSMWNDETTLPAIYGNGDEYSRIINTIIFKEIDKSFWENEWQKIYQKRMERKQISHYDQHFLNESKRGFFEKYCSCCFPKAYDEEVDDEEADDESDNDNEEKKDDTPINEEEELLSQYYENADDELESSKEIQDEQDSYSLLTKWNLITQQQRKYFWCFILGLLISYEQTKCIIH